MGYIKHEAVVVETGDHSIIGGQNTTAIVESFRDRIPARWRQFLVGPVAGSNGSDFWCFLPDGSKEGWPESDNVAYWRGEFAALVRSFGEWTYVGVAFGGDLDAPHLLHADDLVTATQE